jgi:hypothetical protein
VLLQVALFTLSLILTCFSFQFLLKISAGHGECKFNEPSPAEVDEDMGSPYPSERKFHDARPDADKIEEAIRKL